MPKSPERGPDPPRFCLLPACPPNCHRLTAGIQVDRPPPRHVESPKSLRPIPHSALGFKVDQRIPSLREPRPGLHLDDVVEQRALEPELDLLQGGAEGALPAGPRGGARVAGEELQLGGG